MVDVSIISISAKNEASVPLLESFGSTNLLRAASTKSSMKMISASKLKDILRIVRLITGGLTAMLAAIAGALC
jgi:hypothetical protein